MPEIDTLGALIRKERKARGMSQEALAQDFDVNQATVSKWELGVLPDHHRISDIAKFLGRSIADVSELAFGHGDDSVLDRLDNILSAQDRVLVELEAIRAALQANGIDVPTSAPSTVVVTPALSLQPERGSRRRRLARREASS